MAQVVKIEGLKELKDGLEEFSKATSKNIQKRALMNAGDKFEADAQRLAPVATGKLRRSINISTKLSPRQKSITKLKSKVEVYIGPSPSTKAVVQEFGSSVNPPHPYMRPAWDANKKPMLLSIKKELTEEIEKARQRAARRAAKILAKTRS